MRAQVVSLDGFRRMPIRPSCSTWARSFNRSQLKQTFLVHGEPAAQSILADKLETEGMASVAIPQRGQSFEF